MTLGDAARLLREVRPGSRAELPRHPRAVERVAAERLARGADPADVAALVARLNDSLVRRLVGWALAELGPSPAPWAWLAFGSQGRMEQTLVSDQDNALVYADAGEPARGFYGELARRVNDDLVAAGYAECPGGHMAKLDHGSLSAWRRRFAACVDRPDPHDAEILLDRRRVAGRLSLAPLEEELRRGAGAPLLLRFLAVEALELSPPAPFVLALRRGAAEVDLKRHGISPIVFLARCYGLEAGATSGTTLSRLAAVRRAGLLSSELLDGIAEGFRFLLGLQLRTQLQALGAGRRPGGPLRLATLTRTERARLAAAFRVVKRWQSHAAYHFQAGT